MSDADATLEDSNNSANSPSLISQKLTLPAGLRPYYQDESVAIILGDCREILPHLGPVDVVITDPPYGINFTTGEPERGGRARDPKKNRVPKVPEPSQLGP